MGENMDVQALIIWLIVGAIAGWLAGMVVKGGGYGLIGDIIVGIIGGFMAGWLLPATRHCDRGWYRCRDHQRVHRRGYSVARFARS